MSLPALIGLGALLLLAACGPAIVDPEASETPSATPTAVVIGATATPVGTATPRATSTPRPRVTLEDDGLPAGAVGPLLLYRTVVGDDLSFGPGSPSPEVAIWDVGAQAELGRIWIGDPSRQPQDSLLAGRHVLVNFGDLLWRYDLDGSREQILAAPPDHFITSIAADQTGTVAVAAIQRGLGDPVTLLWIDIASGAILREVDADAFAGLGDPHPRVVGAADEPALLRGVTYTEAPGSYATLEADGSVRELPVSGFVTPSSDGRLLAHGPTRQGCDLISGSRIELISVADGAPLASFEDGALALSPWEWSPDGSEFAFQVRAIGTGNESCDWTIDPPRWFVLGIDGSLREAASGLELRAAWYGERAISFSCSSVDDPGAYGRADGLLRPTECARWPADILIGGTPATTGENVAILGFIEMD